MSTCWGSRDHATSPAQPSQRHLCQHTAGLSPAVPTETRQVKAKRESSTLLHQQEARKQQEDDSSSASIHFSLHLILSHVFLLALCQSPTPLVQCHAHCAVLLSTVSPSAALLPPTLPLPAAAQHYCSFSHSHTEKISSFAMRNKYRLRTSSTSTADVEKEYFSLEHWIAVTNPDKA